MPAYTLSASLKITVENDSASRTLTLPPHSAIVNANNVVVCFFGPDKNMYFYVEGKQEIPLIPENVKTLAVQLTQPLSGVAGFAYGMKKGAVIGGVVGGAIGLIAGKPTKWILDNLPPAEKGVREGYYSSQKWCFKGPLVLM